VSEGQITHNEIGALVGVIGATVMGVVGWVVALATGTFKLGHKSAMMEDQIISLRQEVGELRAWREAFIKEHIDLQIRVKVLESSPE